MIRKLLLPAACAVLLGGCVTAGYGYSDGGYYYGRPSARYYGGATYGYGYPYSSYYGGAYGYPYSYGYGGYYGGFPYYYYPRGHYHGDGHHHGDGDHDDDDDHDGGHHGDNDDDGDNGGKPPWRRWADDGGDMLRRRQETTQPGAVGRLPTPSPRQGVVQRPTPRIAAPPPRTVERRAMPERPARAPAPRARSERELRRAQEP